MEQVLCYQVCHHRHIFHHHISFITITNIIELLSAGSVGANTLLSSLSALIGNNNNNNVNKVGLPSPTEDDTWVPGLPRYSFFGGGLLYLFLYPLKVIPLPLALPFHQCIKSDFISRPGTLEHTVTLAIFKAQQSLKKIMGEVKSFLNIARCGHCQGDPIKFPGRPNNSCAQPNLGRC